MEATMVTAILQLITQSLKLMFLVISKWTKWNAEERARFTERTRTLVDALDKTIRNNSEIINENDFMKNLEWEERKRYTQYQLLLEPVLKEGGGYNDLLDMQDKMGFKARLSAKLEEVKLILTGGGDWKDKSILIARELVTNLKE
jgi:hypothetical protein